MKKNINLIYRIEGSKIDQGIDVYDLAPALLSLADLINQSHQIIHSSDERELGINIKPFEKGSFIVDIALFAKDNLQHIIDFANTEQATKVKQTLELIGLVAGGAFGLYGLIKFLKGKPNKIEEIEKNKYKFTSKEGTTIIVDGDLYKLYQEPKIILSTEKSYGALLNQEGVSNIETYLKDDPKSKVDITKQDYAIIRQYAEDAGIIVPEVDQPEGDNENIRTIYLKPKRGSYEGKSTHWSFYVGSDKKEIITATVKDEDFLAKIFDGSIRPHHTDLLKVKLKTIQKIKGQDIRTKHEVMKVLERIEAPTQQSF